MFRIINIITFLYVIEIKYEGGMLMIKRLFMIFILIALDSCLLIGCGKTEEQNQDPDTNQISTNSENLPSEDDNSEAEVVQNELSQEPSKENDEVKEPEMEEPEAENVSNVVTPNVPYTTRVKAPFNIFAEPGYDYTIVDTVWEKGLFTIMEEKEDEEGNLWGKLKSGLGWINLTRLETESKLPVRAGLIEKNELPKDYQEVILDDSEYMVRLAFIANENLKDLRFTSIYLSDDGIVDDTLHTFKELKEGQMFVAGVVFTGDFTTFGLEFVDVNGDTQYYAAYMSGRNGELILQEQEDIVR